MDGPWGIKGHSLLVQISWSRAKIVLKYYVLQDYSSVDGPLIKKCTRVRLFTPRRLVLSHGLGRTHQGGVDLATRSAGESRPRSGPSPPALCVAKPSPPEPDSQSTRLSTRSRPALTCTPCGKIYPSLMCTPKPMAQHQSSWDEKSQAEVKYTDYTVRIRPVAPAH